MQIFALAVDLEYLAGSGDREGVALRRPRILLSQEDGSSCIQDPRIWPSDILQSWRCHTELCAKNRSQFTASSDPST